MNQFNAPKHIKRTERKVQYDNRGERFEQMINRANEYYLAHDIAVIHKKPTPIQIVKVDYPKRSAAKITEAYFKTASTTDYNGVYKGRYVDFEAKETENKTMFPLSNIYEHQKKHLFEVTKHGGISFILIGFSSLNRYFLLPASKLYTLPKENKHIKISFLEEECYEIENVQNSLYFNYLKYLDVYLQEENKDV